MLKLRSLVLNATAISICLVSGSAVMATGEGGNGGITRYRHVLPANNPTVAISRKSLDFGGTSSPGQGVTSGPRYPGDLSYGGGPVVTSMVSHPIYLDPTGACGKSCWGDPEGFLKALGESSFIHVVDQYTGSSAPGRYTVVKGVKSKGFLITDGPILTDNDMQKIVHDTIVATKGETGYGNEYHVFLTRGTDECFDSTEKVCYSPNDFGTFAFCAYHGSVDFPDIGHVLYSVEPYQDVVGCNDGGAIPNGPEHDSQNNVLSHETFETITDPDGNAWINTTDNGLFGQEIGDECSFVNAKGFDPSLFTSEGREWAAQPEYSNAGHACLSSPNEN